jgi:hypothetical protein
VSTVAAGTVLVLALPASATEPSGNRSAIKLYAAAALKTSRLPFLSTESKSFYFLGYHKNGSWNMAWGYPKAPHPYEARVNLTEIAASAHGKNVWEEDTFAFACPVHKTCHSSIIPLRFYLTKTSAYYAELTGPQDTPGCWTNATKTWVKTDFDSFGNPNWYPGTSTKGLTASFFERPVTKGGATTFTSFYEYRGDGAHVSEIDTLDTRTGIFTHANIKVGKTAHDGAFSWSQVLMVPTAPVAAPKIERVC